MGCMMLMELMLRNPGFFGGCFLVAGQWNPKTCGALKKENIWALVSEKDFKAFPIMGDCMKQIEENGGRVTRGSLDAKAPLPEQNRKVRTLVGSGEHIFLPGLRRFRIGRTGRYQALVLPYGNLAAGL